MKSKTKYTNEPMGRTRMVADFLPPPEDLVFREDQVKVTLFLSKASIRFFKREARKRHTKYQKMIRGLLDVYAERYGKRD